MTAHRGFYGKIPSRGDFVGFGLPRGFVETWDGWLQRVIAGSRERLGPAWRDAWMEAPVWRFALPPEACGEAGAAVGLWMPSVDRAGRLFPLTFATVDEAASLPGLLAAGSAWLDLAEGVGRSALASDLGPEEIAAQLEVEPAAGGGVPIAAGELRPGDTAWWSEGSPRVPAGALVLPGLPDIDAFSGMLDARRAGADAQAAQA